MKSIGLCNKVFMERINTKINGIELKNFFLEWFVLKRAQSKFIRIWWVTSPKCLGLNSIKGNNLYDIKIKVFKIILILIRPPELKYRHHIRKIDSLIKLLSIKNFLIRRDNVETVTRHFDRLSHKEGYYETIN